MSNSEQYTQVTILLIQANKKIYVNTIHDMQFINFKHNLIIPHPT